MSLSESIYIILISLSSRLFSPFPHVLLSLLLHCTEGTLIDYLISLNSQL